MRASSLRSRAAFTAVAAALGVLVISIGQSPGETWTSSVPSSPNFAYVSNLTDGSIACYTVAANGTLRPNGYTLVGAGASVSCLAIDPFNKFLMAGAFGSTNALNSYTINTSGTLTLQGTQAPFPGPNDMSFTMDGKNLYYPDVDQTWLVQYSVNQATGVLTQQGGNVTTGSFPETIAVHPTLAVCYVPNYIDNTIATYSISGTGALTEISPRVTIGPGVPGPIAMSITRNGKFAYVATYDGSELYAYSINAGTGALTQVGSPITQASMTNPSCLAIEITSTYLYTSNDGSNNVSVFSIGGTGALTFVQNVAAGTNPARISADPSGKFIYCVNRVSNDISMYSLNAANGQLTSLGTIPTQRGPYAIGVAAGTTAVTLVPKFAYCSNSGDNTVSIYSINAATGALTASTPATVSSGGVQPLTVLVHPTGAFLYVLNRSDTGTTAQRGIQVFSVNQSTGALTASGGLVATDAGPRRLVIEPSGRFLYLSEDTAETIACYSINQSTGALTRLAGAAGSVAVGATIWGITVDPTGLYVVLPNQTAATTLSYAINTTTGALTAAGTSAAEGNTPYTVGCDPAGRFVYVGNNANPDTSEFSMDSTGAFTTIGTVNAGGSTVIQLSVHPSGLFTYNANFNSNDVSIFTINASTGALTQVGARKGVGTRPQGLTIDPSGSFLYVPNSGSNTISEFSINAGTGVLTAIGGGTIASGNTPHTVAILGAVQ
jgi:6-phosphogluconolactonase (cycloisomerase 2 family)